MIVQVKGGTWRKQILLALYLEIKDGTFLHHLPKTGNKKKQYVFQYRTLPVHKKAPKCDTM